MASISHWTTNRKTVYNKKEKRKNDEVNEVDINVIINRKIKHDKYGRPLLSLNLIFSLDNFPPIDPMYNLLLVFLFKCSNVEKPEKIQWKFENELILLPLTRIFDIFVSCGLSELDRLEYYTSEYDLVMTDSVIKHKAPLYKDNELQYFICLIPFDEIIIYHYSYGLTKCDFRYTGITLRTKIKDSYINYKIYIGLK